MAREQGTAAEEGFGSPFAEVDGESDAVAVVPARIKTCLLRGCVRKIGRIASVKRIGRPTGA